MTVSGVCHLVTRQMPDWHDLWQRDGDVTQENEWPYPS